jgi:6-phosphogluconolactonase (cycloisomerase 2 family)
VIDAAPLAELAGNDPPLENVEMCTFLPMRPGLPYRILAANQAADVVTAFDFDPTQGTLRFTGIFAAEQSFPHGIDASADGRFVAITNYGDDTLRIARVAHPD